MYEAIRAALEEWGIHPYEDLVLLIEHRVAAHLDDAGWVAVE